MRVLPSFPGSVGERAIEASPRSHRSIVATYIKFRSKYTKIIPYRLIIYPKITFLWINLPIMAVSDVDFFIVAVRWAVPTLRILTLDISYLTLFSTV